MSESDLNYSICTNLMSFEYGLEGFLFIFLKKLVLTHYGTPEMENVDFSIPPPQTHYLVCLFDLILNDQVNNFQLCWGEYS